MDRKQIDDQHVVARYLADQLPEPERADFEAALATDPDLAREVEYAARLKAGLSSLERTRQLERLLAPLPWHRQPRLLALAASVVLAAVGIALWFGIRTPAPPVLSARLQTLVDSRGQPLAVASTYTVRRTRGLAPDVQIAGVRQPQAVALRMLPEYRRGDDARYNVSLEAILPDGRLSRLAWQQATLASDGFVTVYVDVSRLAPGRYRLSLSPAAAGSGRAETSRFTLAVR